MDLCNSCSSVLSCVHLIPAAVSPLWIWWDHDHDRASLYIPAFPLPFLPRAVPVDILEHETICARPAPGSDTFSSTGRNELHPLILEYIVPRSVPVGNGSLSVEHRQQDLLTDTMITEGLPAPWRRLLSLFSLLCWCLLYCIERCWHLSLTRSSIHTPQWNVKRVAKRNAIVWFYKRSILCLCHQPISIKAIWVPFPRILWSPYCQWTFLLKDLYCFPVRHCMHLAWTPDFDLEPK